MCLCQFTLCSLSYTLMSYFIFKPPDKKYVVKVTTGSELRSETDADVFCVLIGQFGDTGKRRLMKTEGSVFRKGQVRLIIRFHSVIDTYLNKAK